MRGLFLCYILILLLVGVVLFFCIVVLPSINREHHVIAVFSSYRENIRQYSDDPILCQCNDCGRYISRGYLVNKQILYRQGHYARLFYRMYKKEKRIIFEINSNSFKKWLNDNKLDLLQRVGIDDSYWIYCRGCYLEDLVGYGYEE